MNARGRVVSITGMIHRVECGAVQDLRSNTKPLSSVPANKRNKLKKCLRCKP